MDKTKLVLMILLILYNIKKELRFATDLPKIVLLGHPIRGISKRVKHRVNRFNKKIIISEIPKAETQCWINNVDYESLKVIISKHGNDASLTGL